MRRGRGRQTWRRENERVCSPPLTRKSENVATPFTALTVVVPVSVPLPLATAAVTAADDVDTRASFASRIWTAGCVPRKTPLTAPPGCVATATRVAVDGSDELPHAESRHAHAGPSQVAERRKDSNI